MRLTLAHLYPKQMNIYGDDGNILALIYRLRQRNITVTLKNIGLKILCLLAVLICFLARPG